jgi:hypothetical protein
MSHLTLTERNRVVNFYLRLNNRRYGKKEHVVQEIAREIYSFSISIPGIRNLINKWLHTGTVQDKPKPNKHKCLITDEGMLAINSLLLKNPCYVFNLLT